MVTRRRPPLAHPKNCRMRMTRAASKKLEGDLKAHAIADKTSSTKHCPQPRGPRFHRNPSHPTTQKPHSSEGERRDAESAGIQFGICTRISEIILRSRQVTWPASSDPTANEAKKHGMKHISDIAHRSLHQYGRRTKERRWTHTHVCHHITSA